MSIPDSGSLISDPRCHLPDVVVGGGPAAVGAALRLAEGEPRAEVWLIAPGPAPGRSRRLWPALLAGEFSRPDLAGLAARRLAGSRVRWLRGAAGAVDAVHRTVEVRSREGTTGLSYRRLIWAAGASPAEPKVAGLDLPGAFVLRTTSDFLRLADYLAQERPRRGVVVGGSGLALDVVTALARRGVHLTLFDGGEPWLPDFDATLARAVQPELRRAGVPLYSQAPLTGLEPGLRGHRRGRLRRIGSTRTSVIADFVAIVPGHESWVASRESRVTSHESSAGSPESPVFGSPEQVDRSGSQGSSSPAEDAIFSTQFSALATRDSRLATSDTWPTELGVELSGLAAAEVALGYPPARVRDSGIMAYRAFGIELARTATPCWIGDPRLAARQVIDATGRSPAGRPAKVRLVLWSDPSSGRLLAAHVAGREGSAARARLLAAAIQVNLRLSDLAVLDLDLAPVPGHSRPPLAGGARPS